MMKFDFIFHKYSDSNAMFQLFYINRDKILEIKYVSNIICKNIGTYTKKVTIFFLDCKYFNDRGQIVNLKFHFIDYYTISVYRILISEGSPPPNAYLNFIIPLPTVQ